jgi:hypothetical protein
MFYLYFKSYCNGLGPKSSYLGLEIFYDWIMSLAQSQSNLGLCFILQPLFKYSFFFFLKKRFRLFIKLGRFILFGSLKNYLNLSGFPVAFILTYQTEIPLPFVASSLYRGSCLS